MPTSRRPKGLIRDWVYIRYGTVAWIIGLALIIGIAVGGWLFMRRAPDAGRAAGAIAEAERVIARARVAAPRLASLELADHHLSQARQYEAERAYGLAIDEADAAAGLARMAVQAGSGSAAGGAGVRVARVDGDVRVKRAGQFLWEEASEQVVLAAGDQVRTGQDGTTQLLYFDGSVVTISPGTLLEIRELHTDTARRRQRVSERLAWGRLTATTESSEGVDSVRVVSTDATSIRTEGSSEFEIEHDRERNRSEVVALRGQLLVSTRGEELRVTENTRVAVAEGELVDRDTLLARPKLLEPPDQKTFLGSRDEKISTSWIAVPQASRYRLQLSDRSLFTRLMLDLDDVSGTKIDLPPMRPGTYYWRAVAIDKDGRDGRWSEARKFRVAGGEFTDADDHDPPKLDIEEILVVGTNAIVTGSTEPGAMVWIDRERVDIEQGGHFTWLIKLRNDGENK
ncbi:MAG: FecR domain-containing protein, partial [Acidobacteriota bacterium]